MNNKKVWVEFDRKELAYIESSLSQVINHDPKYTMELKDKINEVIKNFDNSNPEIITINKSEEDFFCKIKKNKLGMYEIEYSKKVLEKYSKSFAINISPFEKSEAILELPAPPLLRQSQDLHIIYSSIDKVRKRIKDYEDANAWVEVEIIKE